ncbi:hypothetical protein [Natrinema soli]|uniref:Uncharacterized protein n=1 Tax=Natrinema soli TaxID=1930624 RepID=A0ABD5T175_9EURY|nr:hypothetical protein [Natrinema soli]
MGLFLRSRSRRSRSNPRRIRTVDQDTLERVGRSALERAETKGP